MKNVLINLRKLLKNPSLERNKLSFILKLIFWKINKHFLNISFIYSFYKSLKIVLEPSSSYGALTFYTNLADYYEMHFLLKTLKNQDVFIDIGSNIGIYSLLASTKITSGRIFAFEPNPSIFNKLKTNLQLNNVTNCMPIERIVSNTNEKKMFMINSISELSKIVINNKANKSIIKISSVKLDDFVVENNIQNIKLLKIDVEGAEGLVFEGAKNILKSHLVSNILFELNPVANEFGISSTIIFNQLTNFGYNIYYFNSVGRLVKVNKYSDLPSKDTINLLAKIK